MMDRKYILKSSIKVANLSRFLAKFIDFFIVMILMLFLYPIGTLFAVAYITFADALPMGQSVGKKMMGLRVISLIDGSSCSWKQSLVRNISFCASAFLAIIPFWGWVFSVLLTLAFCVLEGYLVFKLDSGFRLGDVMADTTVVLVDAATVSSDASPTI